MDDLVAFLRARLDEDEAAAVAARDEWGSTEQLYWEQYELSGKLEDSGWWPPPKGLDRHWQLTSPWRVLREVGAKRRIVEEHRNYGPDQWNPRYCVTCNDTGRGVACLTLLALALPYSDHPEYRKEWEPG
jgi:hypothetical protein